MLLVHRKNLLLPEEEHVAPGRCARSLSTALKFNAAAAAVSASVSVSSSAALEGGLLMAKVIRLGGVMVS